MNTLRRLFFENWEFKLFAVLMTLVLFRYVRGTQERNISIEVELEFKYPRSVILTSEVKRKINVILRGPDLQLRPLAGKKLKHTINLSKAVSGLVRHQFYSYQFTNLFPSEAKVIRFRPSALDFMFARRVKRTIPRVVIFTGKEPIGYKLIRPVKPYPPTITLEGPDYVLGGLTQVETVPIDLTGLSRDIVRVTSIEKLGGFVKALGPLKTKVKLRFRKLMQRKTLKKYKVQLINFLNPKLLWSVKPKLVNLQIYGPVAQLHVMKRKDVTVEVDGSSIASKPPGVYALPLRIRFSAPDIKLLKALKTVNVTTVMKPAPPLRRVKSGLKAPLKPGTPRPSVVRSKGDDGKKKIPDDSSGTPPTVRKPGKKTNPLPEKTGHKPAAVKVTEKSVEVGKTRKQSRKKAKFPLKKRRKVTKKRKTRRKLRKKRKTRRKVRKKRRKKKRPSKPALRRTQPTPTR